MRADFVSPARDTVVESPIGKPEGVVLDAEVKRDG
jgi:hypothetical protein